MRKLAAVPVTALVLVLFLGLWAAPATAQTYPPNGATCGVSDTNLAAGDTVTVTGSNWQAGSTVILTLQPEGIKLGEATVDANGNFSTTVTIPASIQAGSHSIVCSGIDIEGNDVSRGTTIQILGGAVGGGGAAFTGSVLNVPLWLALVIVLFAVGVAFVVLGRRRRRSVRAGS